MREERDSPSRPASPQPFGPRPSSGALTLAPHHTLSRSPSLPLVPVPAATPASRPIPISPSSRSLPHARSPWPRRPHLLLAGRLRRCPPWPLPAELEAPPLHLVAGVPLLCLPASSAVTSGRRAVMLQCHRPRPPPSLRLHPTGAPPPLFRATPASSAAPCLAHAGDQQQVAAPRRPCRLCRRTAAPSVVPIDRRPPRPAFCLPWPTIYSASRTLGGSFLDHHDLGVIPSPMAARAPRCGCLEGVLKLHRRAACLPCLFSFHEPCR